ncbi:hypothetical protein GCM10009836_16650 [Pseudonocardia ailaonensis]|uniref:DmpG-like communication domain-containing protein n=1 Tax=Pseudonocardia ailaonensis TaxID=367279 RepID=A0ABN2MTP0_9PSEU
MAEEAPPRRRRSSGPGTSAPICWPSGGGAHSGFLLHTERYTVPSHEILRRCGEPGYVGGREDMTIDVATRLAAEREQGS